MFRFLEWPRLGLVSRRSSKNVTRRAGKRRGPGLNRCSEKASLSSYSLTSSLQLVIIGRLHRPSAARSTLPKLMAPRSHSTAEPGVGLCDLQVVWTHARRLGNLFDEILPGF